MADAVYDSEAQTLIQSRVTELQRLTFADARQLPEAASAKVAVAGHNCTLTTFMQELSSGEVLVTIQVARPVLFGIASSHTERGLVFSKNGATRDASALELQNTGG